MLRVIGIHPMAAAGVIAIDAMLFGGTVVTGGVGLLASLPVGIALAVAVCLIQHCGVSAGRFGARSRERNHGGVAYGDPNTLAFGFCFWSRDGRCVSKEAWSPGGRLWKAGGISEI